MAVPKVIHIEPESETGKLLRLVEREPVSLELEGKRFRIEQERDEKTDIFADYDTEKALKGLRSLFGIYDNLDIEEFQKEILEQRDQDSIGRPAN